MPQKKNPDIAELARGESGRLGGDLAGPWLPLGPARWPTPVTFQEDKSRFSTRWPAPPAVASYHWNGGLSPCSTPITWPRWLVGVRVATDVAEWLAPGDSLPDAAGCPGSLCGGSHRKNLASHRPELTAIDLTPQVAGHDGSGVSTLRAGRGGTAPERR